LFKLSWKKDPFQSPVLVETFCKLHAVEKETPKFVEAVKAVLEQRSRVSLHRKQPQNAYLRFRNVRALLALVDSEMIPKEIAKEDIGYALERASLCAFDELCRQISFYASGDSMSFDVTILSYSMLSYWVTAHSLFLRSFSKGLVPTINLKLVEEALEIIFAAQSPDGTWRKGEPIFSALHIQTRDHKTRERENDYVFFFELVGSLLSTISETNPELLAPFLSQFERCLTWAEGNVITELDEKNGRTLKGWRSNHRGVGGSMGWSTAQVFFALGHFRRLLKSLISKNVLAEFNGREFKHPAGVSTPMKEWDGLMDADLILMGKESTLKHEVYTRVLSPMRERESKTEQWLRPEIQGKISTFSPPLFSLILFGPPGTAKTTIATSMASYLSWNFVTIDTSCFLAGGMENVAGRMGYIFERLKALDKTVILFDEIEEFCLDRENPALAMESRLLTTAMLTNLNELRRRESSIFMVATNRIRAFDAAVVRPGRFDALFFVGTPNLAARARRLRARMDSTMLSAAEIVRSYEEIVGFMNEVKKDMVSVADETPVGEE
jgi:hypothetical protein